MISRKLTLIMCGVMAFTLYGLNHLVGYASQAKWSADQRVMESAQSDNPHCMVVIDEDGNQIFKRCDAGLKRSEMLYCDDPAEEQIGPSIGCPVSAD